MLIGMSELPKLRRRRFWIGNWEKGYIISVLLPLGLFLFALGVSAEQDLYKLLGVSRRASIKEIKQVR